MSFLISHFLIEFITISLGIFILSLGLVFPKIRESNIAGYVSMIGLLFMLFLTILFDHPQYSTHYLQLVYVHDAISIFFKELFIIAALLVNLITMSYFKHLRKNQVDFFAIFYFSLAGMMVMASATEFITLVIGLELMSLSMMILIVYKRDFTKYSEAGLKYMLLSTFSSAILLYGLSLLYGLTGTLTFSVIAQKMSEIPFSPMLYLSFVMLLTGLAFKIALVPFHMWAPDVYEGAPTPITTFLAIGSKVAGFVVFIRLFYQVFPVHSQVWIMLFCVLAVFSMIIGNLIAIAQTDIKRLMAYSSIAQAGYITLGLIAFSQSGLTAVLFYLLLYIFANVGLFAAIIAVINHSNECQISSFSGMWKRSPLIMIVMTISLLSLAGIPPAAGFIGKFFLILEVVRSGYLWLACIAVVASLVSIYYYLLVIRQLLSDVSESNSELIPVSVSLRGVMLGSVVVTLGLGLFPGPSLAWITQVVHSLFF